MFKYMIYEKGKELKIGIAGEYFAMYYLTTHGFDVAKTEQGSDCDIYIDTGNKIWRTQVKTTLQYKTVGNNMRYKVCRFTNLYGKGSNIRKKYTNVDIFCYVCLDTQEIAFLSGKNIPSCIEFLKKEDKENSIEYKKAKKLDEAMEYYYNNTITLKELSKKFNISIDTISQRKKTGKYSNELQNQKKTFQEYGIENLKKILSKYE